jgi:hypothetical protein
LLQPAFTTLFNGSDQFMDDDADTWHGFGCGYVRSNALVLERTHNDFIVKGETVHI